MSTSEPKKLVSFVRPQPAAATVSPTCGDESSEFSLTNSTSELAGALRKISITSFSVVKPLYAGCCRCEATLISCPSLVVKSSLPMTPVSVENMGAQWLKTNMEDRMKALQCWNTMTMHR